MAMRWSNFNFFIVENVWHVHVNHVTWRCGPCGLCAHDVKRACFLETHRCITWNNTSTTIKMVDDKRHLDKTFVFTSILEKKMSQVEEPSFVTRIWEYEQGVLATETIKGWFGYSTKRLVGNIIARW
jgi:hypothetical protein